MSHALSRFALASAILVISCNAQPPKGAKADDFAAFWSEFRAAVASEDKAKLASLAAFPFQTRGVSDSDPVVNHDRAWFAQNIDRLLDQDPGLSAQPEKMRDYIARKDTIPQAQRSENGPVRVANFVFKKTEGKWRFAFAYMEE